MLKKIRHIFSLVLAVLGLIALVWGVWPVRRIKLVQIIQPESMQMQAAGAIRGLAVLETRQVTLEWPESLRIGDQGSIDLVFAPVNAGVVAQPPAARFDDVYARYNLMAEGRLEAAGVRVNPADPRRESLPAGQTVKYSWRVSAQKAAIYPANAWLLLRFLPLQGGSASELPVFVHEIEIRETSLLGLSGPAARVVGGIGMLISLALGYDVMISVPRWWSRHKTQRSPRSQRVF